MSVVSLLAEIERLGRDPGTGGYRRFAFTADDALLAEWFQARASERGGTVITDRCGNQWAWWGDPDAALAAGISPVVTGSHLDSVPDGGPMDGPLGIAAALTAVEGLVQDSAAGQSAGPAGRVPFGVVRFVDEEGARFGLACSGSRLLTGVSTPDAVLALRDADGISYAEALTGIGVDPISVGPDEEVLRRVGVFVELHVEQGRALALPEIDRPVGVASRIWGHGRWRFDLVGRADHAGATRMADRDDPMQRLATLITQARAGAVRHGIVATVGKVRVAPNAVNAIPSLVQAWLDARGDDQDAVRRLVEELSDQVGPAVAESWTPTTDFPADLAQQIAGSVAVALGQGEPAPILATGAGHDAGVLAQIGVPSAMLFVRNPTGTSHSPDEMAHDEDCELGAQALRGVLADLMRQTGLDQKGRR